MDAVDHAATGKKTDVESCLNETFGNRRDWIINDSPPINEIAEKYPRLSDYNGMMVMFTTQNILMPSYI